MSNSFGSEIAEALKEYGLPITNEVRLKACLAAAVEKIIQQDRKEMTQSDEFWRSLVFDGMPSAEEIRNELHDYRRMMGEVPKVYWHITGGAISKPNTPAAAVIALADECENKDIACAVEDAKKEWMASELLPLNEHTREILGRICLHCGGIADVLRSDNHEIKRKAEDEQAAVIHFLLHMYFKHGDGWREEAEKHLKALAENAATKERTEHKEKNEALRQQRPTAPA